MQISRGSEVRPTLARWGLTSPVRPIPLCLPHVSLPGQGLPPLPANAVPELQDGGGRGHPAGRQRPGPTPPFRPPPPQVPQVTVFHLSDCNSVLLSPPPKPCHTPYLSPSCLPGCTCYCYHYYHYRAGMQMLDQRIGCRTRLLDAWMRLGGSSNWGCGGDRCWSVKSEQKMARPDEIAL